MRSLDSASAFGRALADNLAIYIDFDQSGLGETPTSVSSAVRSLLGLALPGEQAIDPKDDDLYAVARNYLHQFIQADDSGRCALIFLAYFSSFFHEARHIHDLLSTWFGQKLLLVNYNYYQNVPSLLASLKRWQTQNPHSRIPLPLPKGQMSLDLNVPVLEIAEKYQKIQRELLSAGACSDGIYSWMTGAHLLEASATAVQLDMTYDVFGSEGVGILWDLIDESPHAKKYIWLLNDILESLSMEGVGQRGVGGVACYFIWLALQGNQCSFSGKTQEPSEIAYFYALASQRVGHGVGKFNLEWAQKRAEEFNREWGFLAPNKIIEKRTKDAAELQKKISDFWNPEPDLRDHLLAIYDALGQSYRFLGEFIVRCPSLYFGGRVYAWALLFGNLPSVRVEFKVNDKRYVTFTRGTPSIPANIWDEMITYSTTLRLLFEGRASTELPYVEEDIFRHLTSEGLKFRDTSEVFDF